MPSYRKTMRNAKSVQKWLRDAENVFRADRPKFSGETGTTRNAKARQNPQIDEKIKRT